MVEAARDPDGKVYSCMLKYLDRGHAIECELSLTNETVLFKSDGPDIVYSYADFIVFGQSSDPKLLTYDDKGSRSSGCIYALLNTP